MMRPSDPAFLKRLSILVVGVHSIVLGVAMLFAPIRFLSLARWPYPPAHDPFFASQSGIFLIILGVAYLAALRHGVLVWLIVGSKLAAVLFLFGHGLFGGAPFQVMLLGAADACLGLLVVAGVMAEQSARAHASAQEEAPPRQ
jgi:hypothetical protein